MRWKVWGRLFRYRRPSVQVRVRVTRNAVISHPAIQVGFLPVRVSTRHLRPIPECRLRVKTEELDASNVFPLYPKTGHRSMRSAYPFLADFIVRVRCAGQRLLGHH